MEINDAESIRKFAEEAAARINWKTCLACGRKFGQLVNGYCSKECFGKRKQIMDDCVESDPEILE